MSEGHPVFCSLPSPGEMTARCLRQRVPNTLPSGLRAPVRSGVAPPLRPQVCGRACAVGGRAGEVLSCSAALENQVRRESPVIKREAGMGLNTRNRNQSLCGAPLGIVIAGFQLPVHVIEANNSLLTLHHLSYNCFSQRAS